MGLNFSETLKVMFIPKHKTWYGCLKEIGCFKKRQGWKKGNLSPANYYCE